MTGILGLCDGSQVPLPELLAWNITRTEGIPCDCFSLTFRYHAEWESVLQKAIRFQAQQDGVMRFQGIVDEYEIGFTRDGLLATVNGRGMQGLLLDNQVSRREYYYVRLSDIISKYVKPYGITQVKYDTNYRLTTYAVEYAQTAWQALSGFCNWAAGITPRFLGDGTLVISEQPESKEGLIRPEQVLEAKFTGCRYGVYSQVVSRYARSAYEVTTKNQKFQQLGGNATRRIIIPTRYSCRAGRGSAKMVLRDSARDARILQVTVREPFAAEPGDLITAQLETLGISGQFSVMEAETALNGQGTECRLKMREYGDTIFY